jgi:hypothetical protein
VVCVHYFSAAVKQCIKASVIWYAITAKTLLLMPLEYHADGALVCADVTCPKCSFNGGYSGYCSQCWKTLSETEQAQATATQEPLEQKREVIRDARKAAKLAEAADKKKSVAAEKKSVEDLYLARRKRARKTETCELLATSVPGFPFEPDSPWPQHAYSWNHTDLSETQVWSCGRGYREEGKAHEHTPANRVHLAELKATADKLTSILGGVEQGSSEGGETWTGFFISADHPLVETDMESEALMRKLVPNLSSDFDEMPVQFDTGLEGLAVFNEDFEEMDDEEDVAALQTALDELLTVVGADTLFRIGPGDDCPSYFVGPTIAAGRTPQGDVVGCYVSIVWT